MKQSGVTLYLMSSVTMNFRWILAFISLCLGLTQPYAGEPLRTGIDVPEPTIIKKVEVKYPFPALEEAVVILSVMIDEQGVVTDVEAGQYNSAFLEAAKSSMWKWRFSPTLVDGKAVPVSATTTILFSLGRALHTFDFRFNKALQERQGRVSFFLPIYLMTTRLRSSVCFTDNFRSSRIASQICLAEPFRARETVRSSLTCV
jgi:hypothetical protein